MRQLWIGGCGESCGFQLGVTLLLPGAASFCGDAFNGALWPHGKAVGQPDPVVSMTSNGCFTLIGDDAVRHALRNRWNVPI